MFKINPTPKIFLLLLSILATTAHSEIIKGKVIAISDGDTIKVLDSNQNQYKIRISGIDAPEKNQALGKRSKENLSDLVFGKEVEIIWDKKDKYQRIVGKILFADPKCIRLSCPKVLDAGLEQIKSGFAWWYQKYSKDQNDEDAALYEKAEGNAQKLKVGLWVDPDPIPPWDWRKKKHHLKNKD